MHAGFYDVWTAKCDRSSISSLRASPRLSQLVIDCTGCIQSNCWFMDYTRLLSSAFQTDINCDNTCSLYMHVNFKRKFSANLLLSKTLRKVDKRVW